MNCGLMTCLHQLIAFGVRFYELLLFELSRPLAFVQPAFCVTQLAFKATLDLVGAMGVDDDVAGS